MKRNRTESGGEPTDGGFYWLHQPKFNIVLQVRTTLCQDVQLDPRLKNMLPWPEDFDGLIKPIIVQLQTTPEKPRLVTTWGMLCTCPRRDSERPAPTQLRGM
ncbi:unnamed protein product [Protopolystoma xenopodis]|uniref:Uncharacterized protein n=1 Tax=Protopolystoma xenopodis TaxID=117903 RepID=A0A448WA90_9PLAT|nr:unnamed protein product [Protopolystoma xenopodis]